MPSESILRQLKVRDDGADGCAPQGLNGVVQRGRSLDVETSPAQRLAQEVEGSRIIFNNQDARPWRFRHGWLTSAVPLNGMDVCQSAFRLVLSSMLETPDGVFSKIVFWATCRYKRRSDVSF
jgi:hypothetical protein